MSRRDSWGSSAVAAENSDPFHNTMFSSSISTTSSRQQSPISKTYRQASTLFLTRRLPEALTTILPLISPPEPVENGEPAPVAKASRNSRIKVWSLYLTIMNAIVELESDEGKDAFGTQEWRTLCAKVKDGSIWEEIVKDGYHGNEGQVDADVVINLATLLLAHGRDQTVNQKRLEAYLATAEQPNLDFSHGFGSSRSQSRSSRYRSPAPGPSGATTPRDLNARVKILELYTLHVLLRNDEWEYAREFITMNAVLDEERREAFLQALQSLQEEQEEQERLEREAQQRQAEQARRDLEEARRLRAENEEREQKRMEDDRRQREQRERSESEVDYGVEPTNRRTNGPAPKPQPGSGRPRSAMSKPNSKPAGPLTLTARASQMISRCRAIIEELANTLNHNPVFVMRFLLFLMGFLLMMGHKGMRQRIQRVLGSSWNKVKATAGMGTKVSYV